MKLYYIPGACSLAPHIVLNEIGEDYELIKVDPATHKTEHGDNYFAISPNGYVPALVLDDDDVLTEGVAINQFLADENSEKKLAPAAGSRQRVKLQSLLNFISTEIHKSFSPLFWADAGEETKKLAAQKVSKRLTHVNELLADGRAFIFGDQFSIADAYLFTTANWATPTGIGLANWPHLQAYMARMAARPSIKSALQQEGLI